MYDTIRERLFQATIRELHIRSKKTFNLKHHYLFP